MALKQRQFGMVFAPEGWQDSARRFNAPGTSYETGSPCKGVRSAVVTSVELSGGCGSCWLSVGGWNLAATDTLLRAGNTSGRRQRPERVKDRSHQLTLLLPTGNKQLTTGNCSSPRSSVAPAGRVVVTEKFPALKRRAEPSSPYGA
jgi:hypothetical protein